MPLFTVEATYHLPVYRHRTYSAETPAAACRQAIEDDNWEGQNVDYESPGETHVTGIWSGANSAYRGEAIPVPEHFGETVRRKADHFDELLAQLEEVAQPKGLSQHDFERWLPGAQAAVTKARAILDGRRAGVGEPD